MLHGIPSVQSNRRKPNIRNELQVDGKRRGRMVQILPVWLCDRPEKKLRFQLNEAFSPRVEQGGCSRNFALLLFFGLILFLLPTLFQEGHRPQFQFLD